MNKLIYTLILSLACSMVAEAEQRAPATVTKLCMNCHGVDGNSESPMFPRLAGQKAEYIQKQLEAYRDHTRTNAAAQNYMWGMARALSDDDIKTVANWFAAQRPVALVEVVAPPRKELADRIFHAGIPERGVPACASCHGSAGEGTAIAPRIAGQHASYVENQLKVLAGNERPAGAMMQPVASQLNAQEIDALGSYLQVLN